MAAAFSPQNNSNRIVRSKNSILLGMGYSRSSSLARGNDRSKRQERVGHLVRTEIATILQLGYPVKNAQGGIDDDLRRRINIVNADVSPDLRQARITVSIMKPTAHVTEEEEYDDDDEFDEYDDVNMKQVFTPGARGSGNAAVDKRRAYAWLVRNTKQVRHALSQRLSHMKSIPNLTFVQADVGAAVDVMALIDKVSNDEFKREKIGLFGGENDDLPEGLYLESELEGDGWIDEDDDDYFWDDEEEDDDNEDEEGEEEEEPKQK
jgi:ribosome-binding factor A